MQSLRDGSSHFYENGLFCLISVAVADWVNSELQALRYCKSLGKFQVEIAQHSLKMVERSVA